MNTKYRLFGFLALLFFAIVSLAIIKGGKKQPEEKIIFTAIPSNQVLNTKFPEEAKIFSLDRIIDKPFHLTQNFYSARSPEVSFDGFKILFTAQKDKEDVWQIWEMDLASSSTNQITSRSFNCTDPAYLPDGRIVFSSQTKNIKNVDDVIALFTIEKDGSNEVQITFHPNVDQNSTVFMDGRILTNTHQIYPEKDDAIQLILRPDGTKAELFYEPIDGAKLTSRGWETEDGRYVFTEQTKTGQSRIVSVNQNRPFNSTVNVSQDYTGEFYTVFPVEINRYLVSYRKDIKNNFSLYQMQKDSSNLALVFETEEYHLIEPVVVKARAKPKILPSRIVEGDAMGIILCMDANLSRDTLLANSKTATVEVFGIDVSFGRVPVAMDGSFYFKVPSNTPLRFQTLDTSGIIINGPSKWIWVRPNERRGCIGCHENKELTPENKVPLAVGDKPQSILNYPGNYSTEQE